MKSSLIAILFLLVLFSAADAQWLPTNGPYAGHCSQMAVCGTNIFVSGPRVGMLKSSDYGENWTEVKGLPSINIVSMATLGKNIFVCLGSVGVYRSSDYGDTWVAVNSGLSNSPQRLYAGKKNLYNLSSTGIYRSTNNGDSWYKIEINLKNIESYSSMIEVDTNIIVGVKSQSETQILRSSESDSTWIRIDTSPISTKTTIHSSFTGFVLNGKTLFAAASNGVFRSNDMGVTWSRSDSGMKDNRIKNISIIDSVLFASNTGREFYKSIDNGVTWTKIIINATTGSTNTKTFRCGSYIFAGTLSEGVFRSEDMGTSWVPVNRGFSDTEIRDILVNGSTIFAATAGSGMFRSTDNGNNWILINNGLTDSYINSVTMHGSTLYIATGDGLFYSTDNGDIWANVDPELNFGFNSVFATSDYIYAGKDATTFCFTPDRKKYSSCTISRLDTIVTSFAKIDTVMFIGTTKKGVLFSTDNGKSWQKTKTKPFSFYDNPIQFLTSNGSTLYAGSDRGASFSTDYGNTWTNKEVGICGNEGEVYSIIKRGTELFAATEGCGAYRSPDSGKSWYKLTGLPSTVVYSLGIVGNTLFAGTYNAGIWKYDLNSVGVSENTHGNQSVSSPLICYPNPTSNSLTIDRTNLSNFTENSPVTYTLTTLTGTKLAEYEQNAAMFTIQINEFASGVYCLTAVQGTSRAAVMITVVE